MDEGRIERVARALGGATSRRGAMAGVLAAMTTVMATPDLNARRGGGPGGGGKNRCGRAKAKCKDDRECCTGVCRPGSTGGQGRCACLAGGKSCTVTKNCCNGFVCREGRCQKRSGGGGGGDLGVGTGQACTPGEACANPAATCTTALIGCEGTRCRLPIGQPCQEGKDCESGSCAGGVCATCSCPACKTACTPTVCPTCPYQKIQDAIDAASDGAVIDIAPGTYSEDLSIDGKSLTLRGCTAGGPVILKNRFYQSRTLSINGDETGPIDIDLIDVTIKGYYALGPNDTYGGGVSIASGSLDLCGATSVDDNLASQYGGGIFAVNMSNDPTSAGAVVSMYDTSSVKNNSCGSYGGGVYLDKGSVLWMWGSSTITGNTTDYGAGVYIEQDGIVTMRDASSISGNAANDEAGGASIYTGAPFNVVSTLTMTDCAVIADNEAPKAGGVTIDGKLLMSGDSSIRDNEATAGDGGGIRVEAVDASYTAEVTITGNATVTGNSATGSGGGLFIFSLQGGLYTYSVGSAITGNTPDQCGGDASC